MWLDEWLREEGYSDLECESFAGLNTAVFCCQLFAFALFCFYAFIMTYQTRFDKTHCSIILAAGHNLYIFKVLMFYVLKVLWISFIWYLDKNSSSNFFCWYINRKSGLRKAITCVLWMQSKYMKNSLYFFNKRKEKLGKLNAKKIYQIFTSIANFKSSFSIQVTRMALWERGIAAFQESMGEIPKTHLWWVTTTYNLALRDPISFSFFKHHIHVIYTQIHVYTYTYIKNKVNL